MTSRSTRLFTSPDRQLGANGNAAMVSEEPRCADGRLDFSAPVPPESDGLRSHVAIERAVMRTADAPAASRPSEPKSSGLFRTPPTDAFRRANGYDPSRRR